MDEFIAFAEGKDCHLMVSADMNCSKESSALWAYNILIVQHELFHSVPRAAILALFHHFCPYYPRDSIYICGNKLAVIVYALPVVRIIMSAGLFSRRGVNKEECRKTASKIGVELHDLLYFVRETAELFGVELRAGMPEFIVALFIDNANLPRKSTLAVANLALTRQKCRAWSLQDELNINSIISKLHLFFCGGGPHAKLRRQLIKPKNDQDRDCADNYLCLHHTPVIGAALVPKGLLQAHLGAQEVRTEG
jgi:hypothetical protein